MATGISFDNIVDAQDYQKMMLMQGFATKLKRLSTGYKVVIAGERRQLDLGETFDSLSDEIAAPPEHVTSEAMERARKAMPPRETRRKMDLYKMPYDVDEEIRELVIDLNESGFETTGSCAGHINLPGKKGFISFADIPTKSQQEAIMQIAEKHGMTGLEFDNEIYLNFDSLVEVPGRTFNTKEEASKYAKALESSGHKAEMEKEGYYYTVYKDEEIE